MAAERRLGEREYPGIDEEGIANFDKTHHIQPISTNLDPAGGRTQVSPGSWSPGLAPLSQACFSKAFNSVYIYATYLPILVDTL